MPDAIPGADKIVLGVDAPFTDILLMKRQLWLALPGQQCLRQGALASGKMIITDAAISFLKDSRANPVKF